MSLAQPLLARVSTALFTNMAPAAFAESWDNVGLLLEAPLPRPHANKVFLTIDLSLETVHEAISDPKVGVIVAYHPPIFSSMKRLTLADVKQKIILLCAAHGISVLSPHTSLDSCKGGINDWLATGLPQNTTKPILPFDSSRAQIAADLGMTPETAGIGRLATLAEPASLDDIVTRIKSHLNLPHVRLATPSSSESPRMIRTIAICAGSGHSVVSKAKTADLYWTGEMGHHECLEALAKGTAVVLCEHSNTERGYLSNVLQPKLSALMNSDGSGVSVDVVCSRLDADPLSIV
ncbi:NGG1 interacting factor [Podochytrium sp. JEL0797]|nr:NGG1 interacting factor [Podochytrium sp. JEL0797]